MESPEPTKRNYAVFCKFEQRVVWGEVLAIKVEQGHGKDNSTKFREWMNYPSLLTLIQFGVDLKCDEDKGQSGLSTSNSARMGADFSNLPLQIFHGTYDSANKDQIMREGVRIGANNSKRQDVYASLIGPRHHHERLDVGAQAEPKVLDADPFPGVKAFSNSHQRAGLHHQGGL